MSPHEIHSLSGAYAVDALDDIERARFEEHLENCEACQVEVAGLREAAVLLGELAETDPPAGLRERVLQEITQVRPLPPRVGSSIPERPRRRWNRLVAAAAVLAVVGVGTVVAVDHANDHRPLTSQAARVLAAADARGVTVRLAGDTRLRVVRSASVGRAVLVTHGLSAPPHGKVYELWLQDRTGRMVAAGLVREGGDQQVLLRGDATEARAAGITVEPDGGSAQPTTTPIALFPFHQEA